MKDPESILKEALELPSTERGRIAMRLIESLEGAAMPCSYSDDELSARIDERAREVEAGSAELLDGRTAIAELRAELRSRPRD